MRYDIYIYVIRRLKVISVGASVQSTAGSRGARISFSNAAYTMFGGGVRVLATHSIRQFPLHWGAELLFGTLSNTMFKFI